MIIKNLWKKYKKEYKLGKPLCYDAFRNHYNTWLSYEDLIKKWPYKNNWRLWIWKVLTEREEKNILESYKETKSFRYTGFRLRISPYYVRKTLIKHNFFKKNID